MNKALNKAAVENVTIPFLARYLRTKNPEFGYQESLDMAKAHLTIQASKRGMKLEDIYSDKTLILENIEAFNQKVLNATKMEMRGKPKATPQGPKQVGTTFDLPKTAPKAEVVTPTEPTVKIVESPTETAARVTRGRTLIVKVDAKKLQAKAEKNAFSKDKMESAKKRTEVDSYPQLFVLGDKLEIEDGVHRIAVNAERGEPIEVAIDPKDEAMLEDVKFVEQVEEGEPTEPTQEPIGNKLNPVEDAYKPAVAIAGKYDTLSAFKNALFSAKNKDAAEPILDRVSQIANEEVRIKLGVDTVKVNEVIAIGHTETEAIMATMNVDKPEAKKILSKMNEIYEDVQKDAIQQIFVRSRLEGEPDAPEAPEARDMFGKFGIDPAAQKMIQLAEGSVAGFNTDKVLEVASILAGNDHRTTISGQDVRDVMTLGTNQEEFIRNMIGSMNNKNSNFKLPPEELKALLEKATALFGEKPVVKVAKAYQEFQDWLNAAIGARNKLPTEKQIAAKIRALQSKYKPRGPRKKRPVKVYEEDSDKGKLPFKPIKNTDSLEKNANGEPILYKVIVDGVEMDILASSERYNNLKPVEFIEIVNLTKELLGKMPRISFEDKDHPGRRGFFLRVPDPFTGEVKFMEIAINPNLFKRGNELNLAKVLAHEMGHLVDYLDPDTIGKSNLLGKILGMKMFLENEFGTLTITNGDIQKELVELSLRTRPWDRNMPGMPQEHIDYRDSANELYADLISAIFFSPGMVEKIAPKTMEIFFEKLDTNQGFKEGYIAIQKMLTGLPEKVLLQRSNIVRESFIKGKELRKKYSELRNQKRISKKEALFDLVNNIYGDVIRMDNINANKGILPDNGSPMYAIDEDGYADVGWWKAVSNIQKKMLNKLNEVGIDELTAGEYMFYKRIVGNPEFNNQDLDALFEDFDVAERDQIVKFIRQLVEQGHNDRQELANPFGFAPDSAQKQLDYMKDTMGPEKFKYLEKLSKVMRDEVWNIIEDAFNSGTYPNKYRNILANNKDYYVTFGVLNYLAENVPAGLKQQYGTLQGIENPIDTTLLKMISLTRWNSKNRAGAAIIQMIHRVAPEDVTRLKEKPKHTPPKFGTIAVFEDGRPVWYQVPEGIAKSYNQGKISNTKLAVWLDWGLQNNFFKHVFITWSVSFAFITNPQRDFKANMIAAHALGIKMPLGKMLAAYWRNNKAAKLFAKGELTAITDEMLKNKALNKPFFDFNFHRETDPLTRTLEELELMKKGGIATVKTQKKILQPLYAVLNWVKFAGSKNEVLSKIAGYDILKEKNLDDRQRAMLTRDFFGTPNIYKGGEITQTTNNVFLFSNVFIQDAYRNYLMATKEDTKSGYWWGMVQYELLPKMLMIAASLGLMGLALKKLYDDIGEYDKTNYLCVPFGRTNDGRVVYARLVHSEAGRLLSGILWKTSTALEGREKATSDLMQILDFGAGQIPGVSPMAELAGANITYMTGNNPYDFFYGDKIIPPTEAAAGGGAALEKMVEWNVNSSGLGQYFVKPDKRNDKWWEVAIHHTPGLNKLIKMSDAGLRERMRDINALIAKENAQEKLRRIDVFEANVNRLEDESFQTVFADVKKEFFAEVKDKPNRQKIMLLRGQFAAFDMKESNETFVVGLLLTPTNKGKARILLEEIMPRMSLEQFGTFKHRMLKHKLITREVLVEMKKLERENTK